MAENEELVQKGNVWPTKSMLALAGSHAVSPEVYWKSLVPNSPMPKVIKDLLHTTEEWDDGEENDIDVDTGYGVGEANIRLKDHHYSYVAAKDEINDYPEAKLLFLENHLHQGEELKLHFAKHNQNTPFLSKQVSDSIPFSSKDLPEIYTQFSVKPGSTEAKILKQTLRFCELKAIEGEEIYCATSLESMVDFSKEKLGEKLKALSTEVNAKESSPSQKYKVEWAKKLPANKAVVCHKQNYAYAVFYCHISVGTTRSYEVSLVGEDGTKVKSVAVCHTDTSNWADDHLAFQLLNVTPGTVPVCHFLSEDLVLWVPY